MKIKVKVIPNAKKDEVLKVEEGFKVYVKSPPIEGKANKSLIKVLAEYFKVKKTDIRILKGQKTKEKIVEISRD